MAVVAMASVLATPGCAGLYKDEQKAAYKRIVDYVHAKSEAKLGDSIEASVKVTNTGSIAADEVVQLYIHQRAGSTSRPIRELKGFERVALNPGETKTVHLVLTKNELTYWSESLRKWVEETEEFDVWIGNNSNAELHGTFRVVE